MEYNIHYANNKTEITYIITRSDTKYRVILECYRTLNKRLKNQYEINTDIITSLISKFNGLFISGIYESITINKFDFVECEKVLQAIYRGEDIIQ